MGKYLLRPIGEIAAEIEADWRKPYFGAIPYIEAMRMMGSATDLATASFADDPADEVVIRFLSNAQTWRGQVARLIKAELRDALDGKNPAPQPPKGKSKGKRSLPTQVSVDGVVVAETRHVDLTDAEAQAVLDADKCGKCKGLGLVRGVGKNAGDPYKTLNGAQQALAGGRAVDCPVCQGSGLTGIAV